MNKMVIANLVHRPVRSIISIVAIALEVTLILLIVALSFGMLNGSKESQLGVGADIMVQPPSSSALIGVTGAPMPVKVGDVLRRLPHVKVAAPVIWGLVKKADFVNYLRHRLPQLQQHPPSVSIPFGRAFSRSL